MAAENFLLLLLLVSGTSRLSETAEDYCRTFFGIQGHILVGRLGPSAKMSKVSRFLCQSKFLNMVNKGSSVSVQQLIQTHFLIFSYLSASDSRKLAATKIKALITEYFQGKIIFLSYI